MLASLPGSLPVLATMPFPSVSAKEWAPVSATESAKEWAPVSATPWATVCAPRLWATELARSRLLGLLLGVRRDFFFFIDLVVDRCCLLVAFVCEVLVQYLYCLCTGGRAQAEARDEMLEVPNSHVP